MSAIFPSGLTVAGPDHRGVVLSQRLVAGSWYYFTRNISVWVTNHPAGQLFPRKPMQDNWG